jgi:hypothetical protein
METARRSLEAERLWRTLPSPTLRHGVAFLLELHHQTRVALFIDQPCMPLFFVKSPLPTQATFVRIDDAYVDWHRSRHGKEVDRSLALPVLKALQGRPEAGALWEKHINKVLDDFDIVSTTHERSIDQGKIDGKVVLLCRQVDDIAVACFNPTVAQGLIDSIGIVVDLKSQGILSSFNGIDIDQRHEYVKVSCKSYLARMLKTHGWGKPAACRASLRDGAG